MNANMLQVTTPQSRLPELIAAAGERAWHGGGSRATRALRAELAEAGSFVTLRWRKVDSNPRSPVYGELGAPGRA